MAARAANRNSLMNYACAALMGAAPGAALTQLGLDTFRAKGTCWSYFAAVGLLLTHSMAYCCSWLSLSLLLSLCLPFLLLSFAFTLHLVANLAFFCAIFRAAFVAWTAVQRCICLPCPSNSALHSMLLGNELQLQRIELWGYANQPSANSSRCSCCSKNRIASQHRSASTSSVDGRINIICIQAAFSPVPSAVHIINIINKLKMLFGHWSGSLSLSMSLFLFLCNTTSSYSSPACLILMLPAAVTADGCVFRDSLIIAIVFTRKYPISIRSTTNISVFSCCF